MKRSTVDGLTARELGLGLPLHPARIEAAQMRLLRRTLVHLKEHSPFYRRWLQDVDPQHVHSRDDLTRLPLLSPQQVLETGDGMLGVSQSDISRIVTLQTSGSTGRPKRIHYSREDLDATRRFFHHGMLNLIEPEQRVLTLLPFLQENSVGALLCEALNAEGIFCKGCWPPISPELAERIAEERINCLVGLPQHLLEVAHLLHDRLGTKSPVQTMLLCSDYAPDSLRRRIHTLSGAETFLHWGSTETGLGGGVECAAHDGCHLRDSQILVEIIDPCSLQPVADGESGEIVITTLQRRAMGLLRYRTGDIGALSQLPCRCGASSSRLLRVHGRALSHIISGSISHSGSTTQTSQASQASQARLTSRELDDQLFAVDGLLDYHAEFREATENPTHSRLIIHYRRTPGTTPSDRVNNAVGATENATGDNGAAHTTDSFYETILTRLRYIPTLQQAEQRGEIELCAEQSHGSPHPDHTFKRGISDNRSRKESCASSSQN